MKQNELSLFIKERKYTEIIEELSSENPVDIAEQLDPLDIQETLIIFRMLPKDLAVEVFANFSSEQQLDIINAITDKEIANIMDEMYFDDMIDLLEEVPANVVDKILHNTRDDERRLINQFLNYAPESAGSLMTIEYVDLKVDMTVEQALAYIMEVGLDRETVYTCYITSGQRVLKGIVSLRKLVISPKNMLVGDLMQTDFQSVHTNDKQEDVATLFKKYGFLALPVVDNDNRLTGIITVDDIMDVIDQEATEDVQRMAAMAPSDDEYLETGVFRLAKNRLTWLLILMISATFTGAIIKRFEDVLVSVIVLNAFIPMLMDTGGNAGSQPSALVIRGLALGEIHFNDIGRVVWKELRVSLIVGVMLAAVNFLRILLFDSVGVMIALVVSITLIFTVVVAKLVGGVLPLLAQKVNIDPAIMAGPLITTIVDTLSLIIYFAIAKALLHI